MPNGSWKIEINVSRLFRRLDESKEHTDFDNEDVIATVGTVLEFGNVNEFGNRYRIQSLTMEGIFCVDKNSIILYFIWFLSSKKQ